MNSKSKRKFRVWDNIQLFQALEQVTQLMDKIDELSPEGRTEDLPMSMLPTPILYNIAVCYTAMYNKLLDEELLQAGYPKSDKSRTH